MADLRTENANEITRAIAAAKAAHTALVEKEMVRVFRAAVEDAMNLHAELNLDNHPDIADSFGWCLWHNGKVVDSWMNGGETIEGFDADEGVEAFFKSEDVPSSGWVGAMVAAMEPVKWFKYDHELGIFNEVIPDVEFEMQEMFR